MACLNKVCIIGNLGKDPEVRNLNNGDKVVSFSVACSESWRDKNSGEKREKTEWVPVVIWNEHLVKVAENYLKKGSKVYIEGALQTRKWEKDGVDRYTTEVVLQKFRGDLILLSGGVDNRDGGGKDDGGERRSAPTVAKKQESGGGGRPFEDDSDIPFMCEWR